MKNNCLTGEKIKNTCSTLVSDVIEGAEILDSYVLSKRINLKLKLCKKGNEKPCFEADKVWDVKLSLLQLLVAVLGTLAGIVALSVMIKNAKVKRKKAKEQMKKIKQEKKELKKAKNNK